MNASSWDSNKFIAALGPMQLMAAELLQLFVNGIETKLEHLKDALQENDISAISQLVHSIKGTAGQAQCLALAKMAVVVEQYLEAGQSEQAHEYCQLLIAQAVLDIKCIQAYLGATTQA